METNRITMPPAGSEACIKPPWLSLRQALRPIFLLSKGFGFASLNLYQSDLVSEKSALIYNTCVGSILMITHVGAIFMELVTNSTMNGHVRYIARTGVVIFNRLCCIVNILLLLAYRKMFVSAMESVVVLDEEWKPAGNEKTSRFIYIELACILFVISTEVGALLQRDLSWPVFVFGIWQIAAAILSLSLLVLQWSNLVHSLARHMSSINDELAKKYPESARSFTQRKAPLKEDWTLFLIENEINKGSRNKLQSEEEMSQMFANISLLLRHHRDIYNTLQNLQIVYGWSLSVGFAVVLVNSVIAIFRVKNAIGNITGLLDFAWAVWKIIMSWLMVYPCQMLLDKTQECADILHSAMQNNIRSKERKQLLNLSIQLLDLPLTSSACNFFLLDNQKLVSVLGTIVTYVIILSQFDARIKSTQPLTNATNCSAWICEP